jgi:4-amino-4-deoxy-L-arabinose transferase-like glycosyltransferase
MFNNPLDNPSWLRKSAPLGLVAATLLLAVIIVNPLREMLSQDDAWSYARMVQHLLATGRYQLDSFTAANLPVQIYLAAGLSKLFGYSLVLLRLTTLTLLGVALISFYFLLRELGNTRQLAAVVTLALLASPLVLILGFAFMSDVQFLAWLLLALVFYVRGIRRQSEWNMFVGSLAAGCAIGTRQFGIALIAGLIVMWLLCRSADRPPVRLIMLGLVVPFLAAAMQLYIGFRAPNFMQTGVLALTHAFLTSPARVLLKELFWRCSIIAQYLGMALLPLLPVTLLTPRSFWRERFGRVPLWGWALVGCAAVVAALCMGSFITARPLAKHRGLWEPLVLDWLLPFNLDHVRPIMRLLDLSGIVGAGSLLSIALYKLRTLRSLRSLRPETLLLASTGFGLLSLHLLFNQINDTYIVGFLPFALVLVAEGLRSIPARASLLPLAATASVILIVALAFWIRGEYNYQEAAWESTDSLYHAGVQPANIYAPMQWSTYHGAYDDWIADGHPGPFFDWLVRRWQRAQYRVSLSPTPDPSPGWNLLAIRSYRNAALKMRYVVTSERDPAP